MGPHAPQWWDLTSTSVGIHTHTLGAPVNNPRVSRIHRWSHAHTGAESPTQWTDWWSAPTNPPVPLRGTPVCAAAAHWPGAAHRPTSLDVAVGSHTIRPPWSHRRCGVGMPSPLRGGRGVRIGDPGTVVGMVGRWSGVCVPRRGAFRPGVVVGCAPHGALLCQWSTGLRPVTGGSPGGGGLCPVGGGGFGLSTGGLGIGGSNGAGQVWALCAPLGAVRRVAAGDAHLSCGTSSGTRGKLTCRTVGRIVLPIAPPKPPDHRDRVQRSRERRSNLHNTTATHRLSDRRLCRWGCPSPRRSECDDAAHHG